MTLPDSNRSWLAVGARYTLDKQNSIDIGYAHVFFADANTARAVTSSAGTTVQTVRGSFDARADLLSVQWNRSFR
jgi:long-chain fatty acid transport protein